MRVKNLAVIALIAAGLFYYSNRDVLQLKVTSGKQLGKVEWVGPISLNDELSKAKKIHEGEFRGPETIAFDRSDKINTKTLEKTTFVNTFGNPYGMVFDQAGNLIVADMMKGILSIDTNGKIEVLTSDFYVADDVDVTKNGDIYFSNCTQVPMIYRNDGGINAGLMSNIAVISNHQSGTLLKLDRKTKAVTTLIDNIVFANGVALSEDESFVLVVDTGSSMIRRYWIKGAKAGTDDIFIESLPGYPDGVRRGSDGTFWVAIYGVRNDQLEAMQPYPLMKMITLLLPDFVKPKLNTHSLVIQLDKNGNMIRSFHTLDGKVAHITSALEKDGKLYLGNLHEDSIAIFDLPSK